MKLRGELRSSVDVRPPWTGEPRAPPNSPKNASAVLGCHGYWDASSGFCVCVFCCCLRWFFLRLQNLGNQLWFSVGTLGGASIKDSQVQLDPDILSGIIVHPVWLDYIRDDISRPII